MANDINKMGQGLTTTPIPNELRAHIFENKNECCHNHYLWLIAGSAYQEYDINGNFIRVSHKGNYENRHVEKNLQDLCEHLALAKDKKLSGIIIRESDISNSGIENLGCFTQIQEMTLGGIECVLYGFDEPKEAKELAQLTAQAHRYQQRGARL